MGNNWLDNAVDLGSMEGSNLPHRVIQDRNLQNSSPKLLAQPLPPPRATRRGSFLKGAGGGFTQSASDLRSNISFQGGCFTH